MLLATLGCAILIWILQSDQSHRADAEARQRELTAPVEPSQPSAPETKKPASEGVLSRRAKASERSASDLEAGTLEGWSRSSYASRLTYSANYVTSRARVKSIEEIRDAAVQLEKCITKVANEGINRATKASKAAAHCLTEVAN